MFRGMKLRQREVIDIQNADILGTVIDVEINELTGRAESIIVAKRRSFFAQLLGKGTIIIPWNNIEVIGKEILLVRLYNIDSQNISSIASDN